MIRFKFFDPHPLLASFVQSIFLVDHVLEPGERAIVGQYPPTSQHCIFLYIKEKFKAKKVNESEFKERPKAVVVGPQITRMELTVSHDYTVAVIGFRPGGLFRLLGIPMEEIFDDGFDGFELMGSDINDIVERCAEMESLDKIHECIEHYLLGKLTKIKELLPVDQALFQMLKYQGQMPITQVADLACLSVRQFERKCKERLGLSPKVYSRLIRFSNAYRLFERSETPNWSEIAYLSGYYDQMHFIKDFKEFAGITPTMMEEELKRKPLRFQKAIRF
ncbi:helix-turn-helix transcriptional regulator [Cecembia lonarensis]|uniref:DNA gyrase inhibitor n=1 Tax=Cecembia lonarensis (strain CCUG 58316 / KCTC 22772 / LW9) TaxID=1225176 RepID=K1LGI2_CECL9|nr:helix-turn-helix transcriptional regulator [Cecembia lonarensis]EKB51257.1 DNA gyrase inhibitor [Cecembia lonarensis LW9]